MIDRRTKNAEIFRDTERRYALDSTLIQVVRKSAEAQIFIAEKDSVDYHTEREIANYEAFRNEMK